MKMIRCQLAFLFLCFSKLCFSGLPPIGITSTRYMGNSNTNISLPVNSSAVVAYLVKNNTSQLLPISLIAQQGLLPVYFPPKLPQFPPIQNCSEIQALPGAASCLLALLIDGSSIPFSGVSGGPVLEVNAFWKYAPTLAQQLNISLVPPSSSSLTASVSSMALSVNDTSLNSALTGHVRTITITNQSSATLPSIGFVTSGPLPAGTSISPAQCQNVEPSGTCTFTITPGENATITPVTMYISGGINTNLLSIPIYVISYGSVYQSGYVFAVDDTTDASQSIGGKVAALVNQANLWPLGIIWSSNGNYDCSLQPGVNNPYEACTDYTKLPGITEDSTVENGDACDGKSDGVCDTGVITNYYSSSSSSPYIPYSKYAAGLCKQEIDGYTDWYLPAICEMGYFVVTETQTIDSHCGSKDDPYMQNMSSNLADLGLGNLFGVTWSSTEFSGSDGTTKNSWAQYFLTKIQYQTHDGKQETSGVRCVRALTQPSNLTI